MITMDNSSTPTVTFFSFSSGGLIGDDVSAAVEFDLNSAPFNADYRGNFPILTVVRVYNPVTNLYISDEVKSATFKKGVLSVVLAHPVPKGSPNANGDTPPQRIINAQF